MHALVVLGTRPEIIKMSPVIRAAHDAGTPPFLLHTGQHYSYELDRVFFEELGLPEADRNLDVGSGPHGEQTGRMLAGIEATLLEVEPDAVLVQGDTNTVAAGALAASKLGIPVGHVEAGLRSYDRTMPEELNRVLADHLSDVLFAPTEDAAGILRGEGLPPERIHVTGNTIVDAVRENLALARARSDVLERLDLSPGGFILLTAHRQENVDDPARFASLLEGARRTGEELELPVVYPIHPRAKKQLGTHGLSAEGVRLSEPVPFLDFLLLEANARLVLTDSGGVQEETCILGTPCVTLRENTERPETVKAGTNMLAGTDADRILAAARAMAPHHGRLSKVRVPFGDGRAGQRIVKLVGELAPASAPVGEGRVVQGVAS